jgi:hypothetical protein
MFLIFCNIGELIFVLNLLFWIARFLLKKGYIKLNLCPNYHHIDESQRPVTNLNISNLSVNNFYVVNSNIENASNDESFHSAK